MQTFTLEPGKPRSHRGGKRAGAGRPKGSPNRAPLDRLYRVMVDGHTPLEVMLANMRRHYKDALEIEERTGKLASEQRREAQQCAMQAAPYCHSRHTNSVVRHELAVAELSDDELAMIAGRAKVIEHQPTLPVGELAYAEATVVAPNGNQRTTGQRRDSEARTEQGGTKPQFQAALPEPWGS